MGREVVRRTTGRSRFLYADRIVLSSAYREQEDWKFSAIYVASILSIMILGTIAYNTDSSFFDDAILSIIAITAVYAYRRRLLFSWEGALLCCAGWVMNMMGAIGAYEWSAYGLGWDKLLHMTSILGLTLLTHAYLAHTERNLSLVEVAVITFLIAQGFGALNEILEFIGTYYFGVGQGLFGMLNGVITNTSFDQYDTHWDLIINTAGICLALFYAQAKRVITATL
jgi:hypothetical protein